MSLNLSDNSTDRINHQSGTSLDSLSTGTYIAWINVRDVANTFRDFGSKGVNVQFFRRGVDGTRLACFFARATDGQVVDIGTGNITTGWNFIAFTWDLAGTPAAYWGNLSTLVTDKSFGTNNGSGAKEDDSGDDFLVGNGASISTAAPYDFAWVGVWNRQLTLGEIVRQHFLRPHKTNGNVLFTHYGFNGVGTQADWSGNGNNGTVTGATVAAHVPLGPPFGLDAFSMLVPTAAPTGVSMMFQNKLMSGRYPLIRM